EIVFRFSRMMRHDPSAKATPWRSAAAASRSFSVLAMAAPPVMEAMSTGSASGRSSQRVPVSMSSKLISGSALCSSRQTSNSFRLGVTFSSRQSRRCEFLRASMAGDMTPREAPREAGGDARRFALGRRVRRDVEGDMLHFVQLHHEKLGALDVVLG